MAFVVEKDLCDFPSIPLRNNWISNYKYFCDKCAKGGFSFFNAIEHCIVKNVERHICCLHCVVLHSEKNIHKHIEECNLVEAEIRSKDHAHVGIIGRKETA